MFSFQVHKPPNFIYGPCRDPQASCEWLLPLTFLSCSGHVPTWKARGVGASISWRQSQGVIQGPAEGGLPRSVYGFQSFHHCSHLRQPEEEIDMERHMSENFMGQAWKWCTSYSTDYNLVRWTHLSGMGDWQI